VSPALAQVGQLEIAGRPVELNITPAGRQSLRVSIVPIENSKLRNVKTPAVTRVGGYVAAVSNNPLRIEIRDGGGRLIQTLVVDQDGSVTFDLGSGPIFGLGEGGPQYDRRGHDFPMHSSQDAYNKPFFGGRMPVGWLTGNRWALFLHDPQGGIDLSGSKGKFTPADSALPIDIFVTGLRQPVEALAEFARLTGFPSMPPLWALGYEQSHRTVVDRDALFAVARNFREKKLPCDVLIYLGTGWAPSGWNTGHRSFEFNPKVFPNPAQNIQELHDMHFKVILHEMGPPKGLFGRASDKVTNSDLNEAANYWKLHAPLEKLGVDGWWPDEGENLSRESRLARIRMYWEGQLVDRPNNRPYTLDRAGYAGMQHYGGWLWSGDLNSTWQTLTNQVAVGINTGLTGVPYWGTDIGGFFSTKELTGELYVRWFQFGAFCPVFRSHGRPSALRYPWSWNTGEMGEPEASPDVPGSALPNVSELHNSSVEPICKKYLDLRYRMLPYIYSNAYETSETGVPLMRALWLYYADDPEAAGRGDEFLWGRDILVAPVTQQGAASRAVYLPKGDWYDFWTNEKLEGGREVSKAVDLGTTPLYVRAGAMLPMGPVKQYSSEKVDAPLTITIYPGADGHFALYDDDGVSFDFEKGQYNLLDLTWNDQDRLLTIKPRNDRFWNTLTHSIDVRLAGSSKIQKIALDGKPKSLKF
jgi:alpha-glucosidase/alpha-D-xyloside xylohydrolase